MLPERTGSTTFVGDAAAADAFNLKIFQPRKLFYAGFAIPSCQRFWPSGLEGTPILSTYISADVLLKCATCTLEPAFSQTNLGFKQWYNILHDVLGINIADEYIKAEAATRMSPGTATRIWFDATSPMKVVEEETEPEIHRYRFEGNAVTVHSRPDSRNVTVVGGVVQDIDAAQPDNAMAEFFNKHYDRLSVAFPDLRRLQALGKMASIVNALHKVAAQARNAAILAVASGKESAACEKIALSIFGMGFDLDAPPDDVNANTKRLERGSLTVSAVYLLTKTTEGFPVSKIGGVNFRACAQPPFRKCQPPSVSAIATALATPWSIAPASVPAAVAAPAPMTLIAAKVPIMPTVPLFGNVSLQLPLPDKVPSIKSLATKVPIPLLPIADVLLAYLPQAVSQANTVLQDVLKTGGPLLSSTTATSTATANKASKHSAATGQGAALLAALNKPALISSKRCCIVG